MVTAETAVAIPVVVIVLAVCLGGIAVGVDQVRCVDAARLGARAMARGDSPPAVRAVAVRAAPSGASVSMAANGEDVTVTVSLTRGVTALGGRFDVRATSVARQENHP